MSSLLTTNKVYILTQASWEHSNNNNHASLTLLPTSITGIGRPPVSLILSIRLYIVLTVKNVDFSVIEYTSKNPSPSLMYLSLTA